MKMKIVDKDGNVVGEVTNPATPTAVRVGQSIRFDETPGPVSLITQGGGLLRTERSAPLYLLGDSKGPDGVIRPVGITFGPGPFPVTLAVGSNHDRIDLNLTMLPALTPLIRVWSSVDGAADGSQNQNPPIDGHWFRGWSQNITILDSRGATIGNFISDRSWGAGDFEGQGLYCHEKGGTIVVNNALFDENGWQEGRPFGAKNQWRHNNYINRAANSITYNNCWMNRAASIGAKTMRSATFNKCLISLASIGAQPLYGTAIYNDCIFYRGSYHYVVGKDSHGKDTLSAVGNGALDCYTDVQLNRCLILGGPPDQRLTNLNNPGVSPYGTGAIKLNKTHNKYTDVTGARVIVGAGCEMHGWDGETGTGRMVSGSGVISGAWAAQSDKKVDVDLQSLIDPIKNEVVSVEDGVRVAWETVRRAKP